MKKRNRMMGRFGLKCLALAKEIRQDRQVADVKRREKATAFCQHNRKRKAA